MARLVLDRPERRMGSYRLETWMQSWGCGLGPGRRAPWTRCARQAWVFLALAVAVAGCHRRETDVAAANRHGILLIGNGGEVQTLDPDLAGGMIDTNPISALYEGLVTVDETTLAPQPGLAERWDISSDGLTYTFHLRPGLRWSNGEPLTAADFVYSLRRVLSPALGAEYKDVCYPVAGAEAFARGRLRDFSRVGIRALDGTTLQLKLERRTPYFLTLLRDNAWLPVHAAEIERSGAADDRGNPWVHRPPLVSDGPFRLVAWRDHQVVELEKNPHYWDAAHVRLNGLRFFPNESVQGQELAFRAGQLHKTWSLPLAKIAAYRASNPALLHVDPSVECFFVRFNVTRKPFDDPRVRRAFSLAIDREVMVNEVLRAGQTAAGHLVPPAFPGYRPPPGVHLDLVEARRLLAEAGFPGGRGFPQLDYLTIPSETEQRIAETLQQMWRRGLGVEIGISTQEFKVYLQSINGSALNYALSRGRWIPEYPDPLGFLEIMTGGNGVNDTGFADREYDRRLAAADAEPDRERRFAALAEAEAYLLTRSPIAPVYFGTATYLLQPSVRGWKASPLGFHNYKNFAVEP
jgi:oligopeptide transport system substrate-binding protein